MPVDFLTYTLRQRSRVRVSCWRLEARGYVRCVDSPDRGDDVLGRAAPGEEIPSELPDGVSRCRKHFYSPGPTEPGEGLEPIERLSRPGFLNERAVSPS